MTARHANALQALLIDKAFDGEVDFDEPMARHTTYRIGGPARYFARVDSLGALSKLVSACIETDIPWMVVGRGSNLLVADEGFPGVIIQLGRDFRTSLFDQESNRFTVGGGVLLSNVVQDAFHRSLAGMEFAVGTPGTIGGALRMNAGSRDAWLGDRVVSVTAFSIAEGLHRIDGSQVQWGYRSTSFAPDEILLECELAVEPADPFYIRGKMEAALTRRRKTQPLRDASCGSVFRNPEGGSAGQLIESAGCKGLVLGGAQVSDLHANFIINAHDASAQDVRALIQLVQEKVREAHGVELTTEVKFLGF